MRKKDILELKKRFKKDYCTFTKMCGCYVSGEKHTILKFRETFLNLDEDEYFKYLEIAKKVLSGTIGNNILELNFPTTEGYLNTSQSFLMELKSSQLKNDTLLDEFYNSVIDNYDYTGNFLILLFHDAYDIITKTTDNSKLDESEEVFEYVLCAICPVSLSEPGLRYFEEDNKIEARVRDWVVEAPHNGFIFPAFINRSTDVNSVMYYTKNPKDTHPELMENTLGCSSKQTISLQKESFKSIIKDSLETDDEKAHKIFMEVQENLNAIMDEHSAMYDDVDSEPIVLTNSDIQNVLIDSGIPEEITTKIEKSYVESFGDDLPLVESLIDIKAIKANEQIKREENLRKQVEVLKSRLEEVKNEISIDAETNPNLDSNDLTLQDDEVNSNYDVMIKVKPEKVPEIKTQIIDGQKYLVIPINENEHTTVNGMDDLV